MRKILLVAVLLLVAGSASYAQQGMHEPVDRVRQSSGDFGLQFDLLGLANLGLSGLGGADLDDSLTVYPAFGAKYFLADQLALRLALGFQTLSASMEMGVDTLSEELEITSTSFSIAPFVTYNVASNSTVAGYLGGGLQFLMANASFPDDGAFGDMDMTVTNFGIGAVVGAEWFPWENVSIAGEYTVSYSTTGGEMSMGTDSTKMTVDIPTATAIGISTRGRALMTFYW